MHHYRPNWLDPRLHNERIRTSELRISRLPGEHSKQRSASSRSPPLRPCFTTEHPIFYALLIAPSELLVQGFPCPPRLHVIRVIELFIPVGILVSRHRSRVDVLVVECPAGVVWSSQLARCSRDQVHPGGKAVEYHADELDDDDETEEDEERQTYIRKELRIGSRLKINLPILFPLWTIF